MCAQVLEGDALREPVERAKVLGLELSTLLTHLLVLTQHSCSVWQEPKLKKAPSNWKHACLGELWDFLQQEIKEGRYDPKFVFDRNYGGN